MPEFDISPFALPRCARGEIRLEEPRDIVRVVARFRGKAPQRVTVHTLRKIWPEYRFERSGDADLLKPGEFGWSRIDDWFNATWHKSATRVRRLNNRELEITFRGLHREHKEFPDREKYNVTYRRTLGVKVEAPGGETPNAIRVFTRSTPARTTLRVELDAGRRTTGSTVALSGYNARIRSIRALQGVTVRGKSISLGRARKRAFRITVDHMQPAFRYAYDDGHLTFTIGRDAFTISLVSLKQQGAIWFADRGFYICRDDDPTSFKAYRETTAELKTVAQDVVACGEQSLGLAMRSQPRPHALGMVIGWRHCREMFIHRANGDLHLPNWPICLIPSANKDRFLNSGDARVCFGLTDWIVQARYHDPYPTMSYNLRMRRSGIELRQKSFVVPLLHSPARRDPKPNEPMVALVRFRFTNVGTKAETARVPLAYSHECARWLESAEPHAPIHARGGWIRTPWDGKQVIRTAYSGEMPMSRRDDTTVVFSKKLNPGESCELVLKIPYIALHTDREKRCLTALEFDRSYKRMADSWRRYSYGGHVHTPEARLNETYRAHVAQVYLADVEMPDGSGLVNTSVGSALYLNYTNESCMILEDLDQRGLHDEVRRRLEVWLKHQGTAYLMGRFRDFNGLFFGAGGLQQGESYNQHHGWAVWYIAEHYFLTRDTKWLQRVAAALVEGVEWVFRQRRETLEPQPLSRGWERGFLPAGALEDVDDYFYWLTTNCLTWRGVNHAAKALAAIKHPDARRFQKEADAFRADLVRGFEISRQYSPLIRLRDGRWIPHYPSRLYCRGRDYGWIREVLEGSVYLLISGLYDPKSRQAQWILDDFQDTRYMNPPYGFPVVWRGEIPPGIFEKLRNPVGEWYHQGGFSFQPTLLAGLLPYLDRDEPEIYIWMFFNAWTACYREEIGSIAEHPLPVLGFSNYAPAKTSDESNATKWLRYMFVYAPRDTLYIGRAVPRAWLESDQPVGIDDVATRFGRVSVRYTMDPNAKTIRADVRLNLKSPYPKTIVRFRHPTGARIKRVRVNVSRHRRFDARKDDVEIRARSGRITIEAIY